ncbi:MAG: bifunctional 4-hydroxy-2-oxoglutarate aldolase/2-dehydro-3-deoxy-phosphogluconate aldolase [Pseudomonadota bacterium]
MKLDNASLDAILRLAPVIPVIAVQRLEDALPLAQALVRGGLRVLEVTLRTPCALQALAAMRAVPGAVVGAGTVLDAHQYQAAVEAGAQFVVAPGLTPTLARAAARHTVPLLPGAATASEVMRAREWGLTRLKFFPAQSSGGTASLKGWFSVFPEMRFCPTGGITEAIAPSYLALPNVSCVGGSWPMPEDLVAAGQWADIEQRARLAAALR